LFGAKRANSTTEKATNEMSVTPGNEDEPPATVSLNSKCMGRWAVGAAHYINYELYKYIQFVNRDEDIQYGSSLQTLICEHLEIPDGDRLKFWNIEGEKCTLEALKRKRQTIGNAFRKRFESECICGEMKLKKENMLTRLLTV
jgi:hypothetical protein